MVAKAAAGRGLRGIRVAIALLLAAAFTACKNPFVSLPAPSSQMPLAKHSGLMAGLGRADITPPPGIGLAGNGTEGRLARGYRTRLYARALVLESGAGERLAIVATDLGMMSAEVHRRAARIVYSERGKWLGADRLIVAATHTHSGPGNFFDASAYNMIGSTVIGYDSMLAQQFARGVADAVIEAIDSLRPASVAWGWVSLWGFTRNRSYESFILNPVNDRPVFDHLPATDSVHAVDPTWLMLRVDYRDAVSRKHRPAGALSVFAIHGTTNAEVDSFYDGDIQALLERGLERHIDTLNEERDLAGSEWPVPRAIHLLANGTEGDVSPAWPEASRCPPPVLAPTGWRPGPRANHPVSEWLEVRRVAAARCISSGREFSVNTASALTRRVAALFDSLGREMHDDLPIGAAFGVLPLQGALATDSLCRPGIGLSALGGAPDGRTRLTSWRPLGVLPRTFTDGPRAPRRPQGCLGTKHPPAWFLQFALGGLGVVPDVAQFTVARVGDVVLATAPAEITTVAGQLVRKTVQHGMGAAADTIRQVGVVSLANGYLSYVTTNYEYARQRYEGASTFYGPQTAAVFADYLGSLSERLATGHKGTPDPVPRLRVAPGPRASILHLPQEQTRPRVERRFSQVQCADGVATVHWIDEPPELLLPHDGPMVRIEELRASTWKLLTWDDDPWVEVLPPRAAHGGHLWRLRWAPHPAPTGPVRVVLERRPAESDTIKAVLPDTCFAPAPGK